MQIYFSKNKNKTTFQNKLTKEILSSIWYPDQRESTVENANLNGLVLIGVKKLEDRNTEKVKYKNKMVPFV